MPRAKRTNRAEARRRYRATLNEPLDELDDLALDDEAAPPRSAESRRAAPPKKAEPVRARPSITAAFRGAFRSPDFAGDLRVLPRLLLGRAFLIPAGLIVVVAAVVIATGGQELISRELAQFFLAPPPLAPVFLAGFLAPRASWLLGGLLGVVQSFAVVAVVATPAFASVQSTPDSSLFLYSLFVSVAFGAFYAAAMAWYKRFLRLANPPRNAPPAKPGGGQKRSGSDGRPLLARRR